MKGECSRFTVRLECNRKKFSEIKERGLHLTPETIVFVCAESKSREIISVLKLF
jgi:hypothetical protein